MSTRNTAGIRDVGRDSIADGDGVRGAMGPCCLKQAVHVKPAVRIDIDDIPKAAAFGSRRSIARPCLLSAAASRSASAREANVPAAT